MRLQLNEFFAHVFLRFMLKKDGKVRKSFKVYQELEGERDDESMEKNHLEDFNEFF